MSIGSHTCELFVEAPAPVRAPWETRLVHAVVEDSANLAAVATLRYRDERGLMLGETGIAIGNRLVVKVRVDGTAAGIKLFTGEVVTLETEFDGTGTFTTIRAMDLTHRLMRGRRVRRFLDRTASEIVQEVATKAGITSVKVDPTRTQYPMVTQANVTDWDFLKELARSNDRELSMDGDRLEFCERVRASSAPPRGTSAERNPYVVAMNENLLALRATVSSIGQVSAVQVRGFDIGAKRAISARKPVDDSRELAIGTKPTEVLSHFPSSELRITDLGYRAQVEAERVAEALAEDIASAMAELEVGVRGNPQLRAGVPVVLDQIGAPFAGRYTVTSSRHVVRPGDMYETWLTVSGRQDRTLHGLASGAATGGDQVGRIPGLATAIVTSIKPDRTSGIAQAGLGHDPDDRGWAKLRFPWLDDEYESDWVRTVQPGGSRGVFAPEPGDEVLVGFEQGLLDRPYVIGGLYNGRDWPLTDLGAVVDGTSGRGKQHSLVSRGGNGLVLRDPDGTDPASQVRLRTEGDNLLIQLDQHEREILIDSNGKITISGKGDVAIRAHGELSLSGRTVSVTGDREVSIEAPCIRLN